MLFADLVGSTELGASQDPERTRVMLDRFYEAMAAEIEAAGGTVEKFAGDAVMAAFGAPTSYEDHAERALHAALSMQRSIGAIFGNALSLRIGVNTGEVVVGRPREGSSFVTGDAVNVAARLEQAAQPGEVLVGERTVAATRGAFEFAGPTRVDAKGKPGGVPARRLLRSLTLMRPRGLHGLRPAFVGRERELERLLEAYRDTTRRGRPKVVTIVGDAGVGKSRLLRELWSSLSEERPEPLRRTGRCLAYGRGITYWPLGEILREHLGILESDAPADGLRKLEGREILGLTLGLDVAGDLHPLAARDRLHEAWIAFLDQLVSTGPAVAAIEDVHWAEPPLLDLLERLARDVDGPLLLVATARPDFVDGRAGWGTGRYDAETIWLEPLAADSATELVDAVLGGAMPAARELVVRRAEGNPLFIEELLASLIDRGILEQRDGRWAVRDIPSDLQIPDTVQAVVAARLDLLEPPEKAALQAAAVIGRTFWTGPVYDLTDAQPDLRVAEDRDFIRRRGASSLEGETEYAFKHAITRQVAYESVPKATRARLHAAFAEWIEQRMARRDEVASLLAHHFAAAANPEDADLAWGADPDRLEALRRKAIHWLTRAGQLAMSRYELDDAEDLFHQAVELRPAATEEVELWRSIGRSAAYRYDGGALWDAMKRAIDLCRDPRILGELYAELAYETTGRAGMWTRFPDQALVQGWIDRALELAEPGSRARAEALIALGNWQEEDRPAWVVEEAEELTERLGDAALRIDACEVRRLSEFAAGRYPQAVLAADRALELERGISDPNTSVRMREGVVALFAMTGRLQDAQRVIDEHDVLSQRLFPHHRLHTVAMEVEFWEILGEWERIRALVPRLRSAVEANLATPCVRSARSLLVAAAACAATGDEDEADSLERQAEQLHMEGFGWIMDSPRVRLALHRRDLSTVRALVSGDSPFISRRGMWYFPAAVAAYLDGLAALGAEARVAEEADKFLGQDSALRPFARRALGVAKRDPALLRVAAEEFEAYGLERQAVATRALEA